MTEKRSGTAENGCAMTIAPRVEDQVPLPGQPREACMHVVVTGAEFARQRIGGRCRPLSAKAR